ncbi:hypothetical protein E1B28_008054 [Marasmius oreades]|uniref:NmrA-like domain-containing protein n=1 Tax=Marasmius oreades TaxID=181124 RepID=A0A9P7UUE8_9AGAR|nr:uncharacterized protein E1B28_008054 [Marasmius oreades]KAG7094458.1 hypothetical protein E1B28_008054 [Marasmius oreades]
MASHTKHIVLLVGSTGKTGSSIVRALAKLPEKYVIKALVRRSSMDKPIVQEFRNLGVEIVPGDLAGDTQESLETKLNNVDIVINATIPVEDGNQNKLFLAAKNASVKRVVPSDFGPSAPPGAMKYQDTKLKIRQFIIENEIPYTFIQAGWLTSLLFPQSHSVAGNSPMGKQFYGSGKVKTAYTALERVGEFVARIIGDPRTLNQIVQAYDGEATLEEVWTIASKVTGENFDDYTRLSAEDIESTLRDGPDFLTALLFEYNRSALIRGDNTVENAVSLGALDARVLYPDYVPLGLEEVAKQVYGKN